MKHTPSVTYDPETDLFTLAVRLPEAERLIAITPEQARDLRIDLRRETWRRAEELGEHGR